MTAPSPTPRLSSLIYLTNIYLHNYTPIVFRQCLDGCYSFCPSAFKSSLIFCIARNISRVLVFIPPEGRHNLETMTSLLYLDEYTPVSQGYLWYGYLPTDLTYIFLCGSSNSHIKNVGKLEFCLRLEIVSHKKVEPPHTRVRLLPISIFHTLDSSYQHVRPILQAFRNLMQIRLLLLLHTSKYCNRRTDTTSHPFNLQYVQLLTVPQYLNNAYTPNSNFYHTNFTILLFTAQKNGVNIDSISNRSILKTKTHLVTALHIGVAHLWHNVTTTNYPLDNVQPCGLYYIIKSNKITAAISFIIRASILDMGLMESYIRKNYFCSGGAMALLLLWF